MSAPHPVAVLKNLSRHPFWVVLGGAAGAQLIAFVGAPLLTRLYTPEAFGILSLYTAALSVAGAAVGGRYEQAIISENHDRNADDLVALVACCALTTAAAGAVILSLMGLDSGMCTAMQYALPATVFYVVGVAVNNWLVRQRRFRPASSVKIMQAVIVLSLAFLLSESKHGLIQANLIGYLCAAIALIWAASRGGWAAAGIRFKHLLVLARANARFPLHGLLPAILDGFAALLPLYWLAGQFDQGSVGQFGLTRQVIAVPLGMISMAVSTWLTKIMTDAVLNAANLRAELSRLARLLFLPLTLFAISVSLTAPQIFRIFFGADWFKAGEIAQWMVWAYVTTAFASPLSATLIVLKRIAVNGLWQAAHFVVLLLALNLFSFENVLDFSKTLALLEIISYGGYALVTFYVANSYDKKNPCENYIK